MHSNVKSPLLKTCQNCTQFGSSILDDASIRVLGLRLSIRQLGFIFLPYWVEGGVETIYERLLIEMSVNDYFSLEEAIFTGNVRSSTPSLAHVWASSSPVHRGAGNILGSARPKSRYRQRNSFDNSSEAACCLFRHSEPVSRNTSLFLGYPSRISIP